MCRTHLSGLGKRSVHKLSLVDILLQYSLGVPVLTSCATLSVSFLDLRSFTVQFVTYEVDYGGFNNVRMTLETLLVFAKATGRTIVLPPKSPIYLLKPKQNSTTTAAGKTALEKGKGGAKKAAPLVSAVDYFREGIEALQRDNVLDVITFQEFVQSESQAPGGVVFDAALRIQAALQVDPAWGVTNSRGNADGVSPKRTKTKETAAAASGIGAKPADLRDLLLAWNTAAEQVHKELQVRFSLYSGLYFASCAAALLLLRDL